MTIYEIANYGGSRDYARLAELAKMHSVICMVDNDGCRDAAKTVYKDYRDDGAWEVGARGICYVWAHNKADFVRKCATVNLEFIEPPKARIE